MSYAIFIKICKILNSKIQIVKIACNVNLLCYINQRLRIIIIINKTFIKNTQIDRVLKAFTKL